MTYNSILELIGNTPLVKLNKLTKNYKSSVYAKMESLNPGGSVKDRIGVAMIEDAEKKGLLKPNGVIIEATSGNTGIGLALAATAKEYKCIFVMTEKVSVEKRAYLKALGAEVVICPMTAPPESPENYVNVAKRINKETPNSFFTYQYTNPSNPEIHYRTTGPEIWEQSEGKITHFIASAGTGGTISGVGKFLKEKNSAIKVICADPYGSIFKTYKEAGKIIEGSPYLVEGIGQDMIPENVHFQYIDDFVNVTDKDSFLTSRKMSREEGIFCGGSAGTNAFAALKISKELDENGFVVFIIPDIGERYLSKHHSDEWMREKRLLDKDRVTVGIAVQTKLSNNLPKLVSVKSGSLVSEALKRMEELDLSQIPVIDDNKSVGSLNDADLMSSILIDANSLNKKVSELMKTPFPVHDEHEDLKNAISSLKKFPAVLVSEYGKIVSVLTRHDVLDFV